ncbi:hypothetical protein SOHN41_01509 [Shewanella sp. HN-41]|nr:hypothetical protein SOHN41_01509 [Shewanella sp. HN-41]
MTSMSSKVTSAIEFALANLGVICWQKYRENSVEKSTSAHRGYVFKSNYDGVGILTLFC